MSCVVKMIAAIIVTEMAVPAMMIELLGQIVLFLTLFLNFFWDKCLIST